MLVGCASVEGLVVCVEVPLGWEVWLDRAPTACAAEDDDDEACRRPSLVPVLTRSVALASLSARSAYLSAVTVDVEETFLIPATAEVDEDDRFVVVPAAVVVGNAVPDEATRGASGRVLNVDSSR